MLVVLVYSTTKHVAPPVSFTSVSRARFKSKSHLESCGVTIQKASKNI
eukprot:SAG31_NODE_13640_length_856_cov_0.762219_1_plen_47_part_10